MSERERPVRNVVKIERTSEAFAALAKAFADPGTATVHLSVEVDGLLVKVDGGMWSPRLDQRAGRAAK